MKVMKMIDPDALSQKLTETYHGMISDASLKIYQILRMLDEQLTVDVAEVVPCKECDWSGNNLVCTNPHCTKSFYGCPVPPDHYCSYGVHKKEQKGNVKNGRDC